MRLRNRLFPVIGIALSIMAAPYLAGQLTLWFLSLTDPPVTWHLWSDYARVMHQAGYAAYAWRIRLAGGLGFGIPLLVILACVVTLIRAFRVHRALRPTPRFEPLTHVSAAFRHGVVLARGIATDHSVLVVAPNARRALQGTLVPTLRRARGPWLLVGTPEVIAAAASQTRGRPVVRVAAFGHGHRWNPFAAAWSENGLHLPVLESLAERWFPVTDPRQRLLTSHARQAFVALVRAIDDVLRHGGEVVIPAPGDLQRFIEPLSKNSPRSYLDHLIAAPGISEATRQALQPWCALDDKAFARVSEALRGGLGLFSRPLADAATRGNDLAGIDLTKAVVLFELPADMQRQARPLVDAFIAWWRHATREVPHRRLILDGLDHLGHLPVLLDGDVSCLATTRRLSNLRTVYGRDFSALLQRFPCVVMQTAPDQTTAEAEQAALEAYVSVHEPHRHPPTRPATTRDMCELKADHQLVLIRPHSIPRLCRIPTMRYRPATLPDRPDGDAMPFPRSLAGLLASLITACSTQVPGESVAPGWRYREDDPRCNSMHKTDHPPQMYIDACLGPHRFRFLKNLYVDHIGQDLVGTSVGLAVQWPSLEPLPLGLDYHANTLTFISNVSIDIRFTGGRSKALNKQYMLRAIQPLNPNDPVSRAHPGENLGLRLKEAPVYGLTPYLADFDKLKIYYRKKYGVEMPAASPDNNKDWFVQLDEDGVPTTLISCDSRLLADGARIVNGHIVDAFKEDRNRSLCEHQFLIQEYDLIVYVSYLRVVMHDWQRIEAYVRRLIASTEVKP